jgi:hypothetical protein
VVFATHRHKIVPTLAASFQRANPFEEPTIGVAPPQGLSDFRCNWHLAF